MSPMACFIFDDQLRPTPALLTLLASLNIQHDGTLPSIVKATQKAWIIPNGVEYWHLQETITDRDTIIELLNNLGCVRQIVPRNKQYDYAIVLGSILQGVRSRLAFLLDQWNQGMRFKTLVFLGSERLLYPEIESPQLLLNPEDQHYSFTDSAWEFSGMLPKSEFDMIKLVFDQTALPSGLEKVAVAFINTPNNSLTRRPNTIDTIKQWLNFLPVPGSCTFISNQPFIGYQDAAIESILPAQFSSETIGPTADPNLIIAGYLDAIARWIYQEYINSLKS